MATKLNAENFDSFISADSPSVVDFWASWCGPCRAMGRVIDELPELRIGKVDVDEQGELAARYGVSSIPTLILFKNGEEVERAVGAIPKSKLEQMFK